MSKSTLILIISLSLFTAGLLVLALNKSSYTSKFTLVKPILPSPTINPYLPDTSLLFGDIQVILASESANLPPGSPTFSNIIAATQSGTKISTGAYSYLLPIIINTGINKVKMVQLELAFDPSILTYVNLNPSNFFENPTILINRIDGKSGRISYALGLSASESANTVHRAESGKPRSWQTERGKQGEGTLATLTFETINPFMKLDRVKIASDAAKTTITFLPKTFVAAEGMESSALKSTNSAKLTY